MKVTLTSLAPELIEEISAKVRRFRCGEQQDIPTLRVERSPDAMAVVGH